MIRSFRDKQTEKVFNQEFARKLPPTIQSAAKRLLDQIAGATRLEDLKVPPGNQLEPLQGDRWGQHSVRIDRQWRICFTWRDGHADDVEICDYH